MTGFFTDYLNNQALDLLLGGQPVTPPAVLWVGLSLEYQDRTGAIVEPTGGGYARVAIPNVPGSFKAAPDGSYKTNAAPIVFPAPTADWGTPFSLFTADAATGGNVLVSADLTVQRMIRAGSPPPAFVPGALYLSTT
jgi:hypothetical protein